MTSSIIVPEDPPPVFRAVRSRERDSSPAFYRDALGLGIARESDHWGTDHEHLRR
ncbi:MAG: hypothetical protein HYR85_22585 [Planctomycetes bacterium]|nr:hypothetical protein [Planctomycetota bacterium]MBI3843726.1 hypothetical protein [Planctomycetota bacterium]